MKGILQKLIRSERGGYTLLELLVVLAILGLTTAVTAMTIGIALNITATNSAQSILLCDVYQAASWISKDVLSADNITPDNGTVLCSLKRYAWNGADNITNITQIDYVVSNSQLLRKVNGSSGGIVAEFIKYPDDNTTFTKAPVTATENNTYLLKLHAIDGNSSYNQQFKIYQRIP